MEQGDSGSWAFSSSGVQPTFDPDEYWGGGVNEEEQEAEALGGSQQSTITTANGVFGYLHDWDGVASASDPALAAARLLHNARQMTDTSRWWTCVGRATRSLFWDAPGIYPRAKRMTC